MIGVSIERGCRLLLALMFVLAALPKLWDLSAFAQTVGAYGFLPVGLVTPVAFFLPLFELYLAYLLFARPGLGLWLSCALLLLFIAILSYAQSIGLDIDCGCFGPEDPESRAFSGLREAVWRDVGFLALGIVPLLLRRVGVVNLSVKGE